jgi:hypothetical protein
LPQWVGAAPATILNDIERDNVIIRKNIVVDVEDLGPKKDQEAFMLTRFIL